MFKNDYGSVVEKWKVDIIVSRARRLGFREHDLEDAQQQIVMELLAFEYDPARSNGATEETAITSLIDHQLLTLRRSRNRYAERATTGSDAISDDESLARECHDYQRVAMRADITTVMSRLSPFAQQVCAALGEGLSVNEIAQRLGVGWHTVERQVQVIRECFERLGIHDAVPA